jgi:hypothetical protein
MATSPPASPDVFAKARDHERLAMLAAAREADVLPYFRTNLYQGAIWYPPWVFGVKNREKWGIGEKTKKNWEW